MPRKFFWARVTKQAVHCFTPRQLGEGQDEELFVSGACADTEVAAVTGGTLVEFVLGQAVQELGEAGATFVPKMENRQKPGIHPHEPPGN